MRRCTLILSSPSLDAEGSLRLGFVNTLNKGSSDRVTYEHCQ